MDTEVDYEVTAVVSAFLGVAFFLGVAAFFFSAAFFGAEVAALGPLVMRPDLVLPRLTLSGGPTAGACKDQLT